MSYDEHDRPRPDGTGRDRESPVKRAVDTLQAAGLRAVTGVDGKQYLVAPAATGAGAQMVDLSGQDAAAVARRVLIAAGIWNLHDRAVGTALSVLSALAPAADPVPVRIRAAAAGGKVYYDLGDAARRAVELDPAGWRVVDRSPVPFFRPRGMLPLDEPARGDPARPLAGLAPFRDLLGFDDESLWARALGWALSALHPTGPYLVGIVRGREDAGKSTLCRALRRLVDPHAAPLTLLPTRPHDLMVAASKSRVLAFDNQAGVTDAISDVLCQIATGSGVVTREYYTTGDTAVMTTKCPILINGIGGRPFRSDLVSRAVVLDLDQIDPGRRLRESEIEGRLRAMLPGVLGGLLDLVVLGLQFTPVPPPGGWPRMADAAHFVEGCLQGAGWTPHRFVEAMTRSQRELVRDELDSWPVFPALVGRLRQGPYRGTLGDLIEDLEGYAGQDACRPGWPGTVEKFAADLLGRYAGALRRHGVQVRKAKAGRSAGRQYEVQLLDPATGLPVGGPSGCFVGRGRGGRARCSRARAGPEEVLMGNGEFDDLNRLTDGAPPGPGSYRRGCTCWTRSGGTPGCPRRGPPGWPSCTRSGAGRTTATGCGTPTG